MLVHTLRTMIVHPVKLPAYGTSHTDRLVMRNEYVNLLRLLVNFDPLHVPRILQPKKLLIKFFCVHDWNINLLTLYVGGTH